MCGDYETQMQTTLERVEHFKKLLPMFAVQYKQARRQAKKLRRTEEMRERAEMRAHPLNYWTTVDGWAGRTWEEIGELRVECKGWMTLNKSQWKHRHGKRKRGRVTWAWARMASRIIVKTPSYREEKNWKSQVDAPHGHNDGGGGW